MRLRLGITDAVFEEIAIVSGRGMFFEGYPWPMSKKKRACVVTYRHSDDGLFENSLRPSPNITDL
jgi:hypothetical protein